MSTLHGLRLTPLRKAANNDSFSEGMAKIIDKMHKHLIMIHYSRMKKIQNDTL